MRHDQWPTAVPALTFGQAFDPKRNAFGFLRLLLAVLVIFSHAYTLGGFGQDPIQTATKGQYSIGLLAVAMFFVLSGFLICRSACGSLSIGRFLWHRFLRIFPGYWVCLIFCACVFAPFVALVEFHAPLRVFSAPWDSPLSFIWKNAAVIHANGLSLSGVLLMNPTSIAGLLRNNPFPFVINGSLWTLPFEVACYVCAAGLAAIGAFRRPLFLLFFVTGGLGGLYGLLCLDPKSFQQCFPYPGLDSLVTLTLFFFAGCLCFLYREVIPNSRAAFFVCLVAAGASLSFGVFGLLAPVTLTYICLWLAFRLPLPNADARGDFSYGAYIYAFPAQQGLALLHVNAGGFLLYFVASLLLTSVLAFLSYRLVEGPCLKLKNWGWRSQCPRQPTQCAEPGRALVGTVSAG